ncbi:hypothetical protein Sjap_019550 [Stephania japonica]|uniref:Reverse transcriptase n=1 Tax=Stephania japonica TaxID=461633 RepID=A0AAP0F0B8_9MAGN
MDRINNKVLSWKENLLSMAGKEVVLKSVAQAILRYQMLFFSLLKTTCQSIQQSMARFWWAASDQNRGIHWMK